MGLDDNFGTIKTQILSTKPTPSLGIVYHLMDEDEQQKNINTAKNDGRGNNLLDSSTIKNRSHLVTSQFSFLNTYFHKTFSSKNPLFVNHSSNKIIKKCHGISNH